MSSFSVTRLPEGRAGRLSALALAGLVVILLWGVISSLAGWYGALKDRVETRTYTLERVQSLVASIPRLRQQAADAEAQGNDGGALIREDSDATAQARLQELVQMAGQDAGIQLSSEEPLPLVRHGGFERLALRVSMSGSWPSVVRFLDKVGTTASPALLIDDLQIQVSGSSTLADEAVHGRMVDASVTVIALRSPAATSHPVVTP